MISSNPFIIILSLCGSCLLVLILSLTFRTHFQQHFKRENDLFINVTVNNKTARIRYRFWKLLFSANNIKNYQTRIIWIVFIAGHGDTLEIWDALVQQLVEQIKKYYYERNITHKISFNILTYDRIGYGLSSYSISLYFPIFQSITAHDRNLELKEFLTELDVKLYDEELIFVGHSYGGLIAQSFIAHMSAIKISAKEMNIKLLLLNSSFVDIHHVIGKFEVNRFGAYKDYIQTASGLCKPRMFFGYPSIINSNMNENVRICYYFRSVGKQIISQWNESLGFWNSMSVFGKDLIEWTETLGRMKSESNIHLKIVNLFTMDLKSFFEPMKNLMSSECLIENRCIYESGHYIHLTSPQIVIQSIFKLVDS